MRRRQSKSIRKRFYFILRSWIGSIFLLSVGLLILIGIVWSLEGYKLYSSCEHFEVVHSKIGQTSVGQPKVKEPKVEESKVEESKIGQFKVDQTSVGQSKVKESKVEEHKISQPKIEESKVEESKADQLKVEESKVEEPKVGQPKVEKPSPILIACLLKLFVFSDPDDHSWTPCIRKNKPITWILELNASPIDETAKINSYTYNHIDNTYNSIHFIGAWRMWSKEDYKTCLEDLSSLEKIISIVPVHISMLTMEYPQETARLILFLMRILEVPELAVELFGEFPENEAIRLEELQPLLEDIAEPQKQRETIFYIDIGNVARYWEGFIEKIKGSYNIKEKRLWEY